MRRLFDAPHRIFFFAAAVQILLASAWWAFALASRAGGQAVGLGSGLEPARVHAFLMIYGFFPLYFPELFPTAVRATGQGFAFNFGRIIAAIGGLQTATLMSYFGGSFPKAGSVLVAIYLVGAVIVWLGPETKGRPLPD